MGDILFSDLFTKYENNILLQDEHRCFSYAEAKMLGQNAEFRVTRRRLVFCLVENNLSSLAGYLALMIAEAVPMMLGSGIVFSQLQTLISAYRPAFIWMPDSRKSEFAEFPCIFSLNGWSLLDFGAKLYRVNESLALLLSTSGSTGTPKFVRLSHQNIMSNAKSIAQYMGLTGNDIPITTLPPSYTYGLSIIHSHLCVGAKIAITDKTFFDKGFWNFFRNIKATNFGGVPYHYEMLKRLRFTEMNLPSLNLLSQAGGRMEVNLVREFAEFAASKGIRFFTMYGQVEATARMSFLPPLKTITKPGSIGAAIPGGEFWIEDENSRSINAVDVIGQLMYRGPNVFMGYAHKYSDLPKGDDYHGVLPTGDMAKSDLDGDYYIVGRLKRFLKLFGHRVNLLDVEEFLAGKGYLVACAGQDNLLEIYCPKIVEEESQLIKKITVEYLKLTPKSVMIYAIKELPRTDAGKIKYAELTPQIGTLLL